MNFEKLAQNFYTGKETQRILGMSEAALEHAVRAGRVVKVTVTGKRPLYTRESVDALAAKQQAELLAALRPQLSFRKAEVGENLEFEISRHYFGDLSEKYQHRRASKYEQTYYLFDDAVLVSFFTLIPLDKSGLERFMKEPGWALSDAAIPLEPGHLIHGAISLVITPMGSSKRRMRYARRMLHELSDVFAAWGAQGIEFGDMCTNVTQLTDRQLLVLQALLGFEFRQRIGNKRNIYCLQIPTATTPLLRPYQQALRRWKNKRR